MLECDEHEELFGQAGRERYVLPMQCSLPSDIQLGRLDALLYVKVHELGGPDHEGYVHL
jgi:hypothetical protein